LIDIPAHSNPRLTGASECLQDPPPETVEFGAFSALRSNLQDPPPETVEFGAFSALRSNFGKQSRSHHKKICNQGAITRRYCYNFGKQSRSHHKKILLQLREAVKEPSQEDIVIARANWSYAITIIILILKLRITRIKFQDKMILILKIYMIQVNGTKWS